MSTAEPCTGALNIKGEHIGCDREEDHPAPCGNREHGAIWQGPDEDQEGMITVAKVLIGRFLTEDDTIDVVTAKDGQDDPLDLSTALGMMRLAEDTLIRERMGDEEA